MDKQTQDMLTKQVFKKAMTNPAKVFADPKDVLEDNRFSPEQKIKILDSWAVDANGLIRAESENMKPPVSEGKGASLLKSINKAIIQIESSH